MLIGIASDTAAPGTAEHIIFLSILVLKRVDGYVGSIFPRLRCPQLDRQAVHLCFLVKMKNFSHILAKLACLHDSKPGTLRQRYPEIDAFWPGFRHCSGLERAASFSFFIFFSRFKTIEEHER